MTLNITFYTPKNRYWWTHTPDAWFYRPDESSTGGTGFKVPLIPRALGLHVCFSWGMAR